LSPIGTKRLRTAHSSRMTRTRATLIPMQLASVLPWRLVEPAPAGAEKTALVGKAQKVCRLPQGEVQSAEILLRELAARVIEQLDERCRFLLQPPLQGAFAHTEFAGDLIASWFAIWQAADDHFARSVADLRMVEMSEVFAGEPLVQLGNDGI